MTCLFCSPRPEVIILHNPLWYARWDKYPVSKGHMLVIPFRHIQNCFDSAPDERNSLFALLDACRKLLDEKYAPDGYNVGTNVGTNVGRVAGQSVMHCHIHVIPRYAGDTDHPRGGIRGVIPGKRDY